MAGRLDPEVSRWARNGVYRAMHGRPIAQAVWYFFVAAVGATVIVIAIIHRGDQSTVRLIGGCLAFGAVVAVALVMGAAAISRHRHRKH
ncbi:hypothetical protein [Nakamurella endophytica]|uniref:hypothetical protein n=1 Tax=Nakamurella endophytica TaxID=1748367 RepID=UPI001668371D|nr:hypothetical protein [Nakamurella endophytica]